MSTLDPKIFKAYDIRGIYPTDINDENATDIARAIYTFLSRKLGKRKFSVGLGRDMRVSSPSLAAILKDVFVKSGATIIDIGLASTPTTYFATRHYSYDTGIQITASHNPKEYAGMKMVIRDGEKLIKIGKNTGMLEIKELAMNKDFEEYTNDGEAQTKEGVLQDEVTASIDLVKPQNIANIKMVADAANAMGAVYTEEIAKRFPMTLVPMNFELDGTFPVHHANPSEEHTLIDLKKKIVEEKADIGLATDGDGDRVMFIDEKGETIPPTAITALIVHEILNKSKNERFIVDIRYIRNVQNICKAVGAPVTISKVGHAFITEQLNNEGAAFAGESSGHYFFRETGGGEGSIPVILYVLEVMGREKKPISEIVKSLQTSIESGEYNFVLDPTTSVPDLLSKIEADYQDGEVSKMDGIAIDFPEWRFGIRTSNTEPLLRLNVEGETKEIVQEKLHELTDKILASGAKAQTGH